MMIAKGTPEEVAEVKDSYTDEFLKPMLKQGLKIINKKLLFRKWAFLLPRI